MLLTIDIGNTNIKTSLFNKNEQINFIVHSDPGQIIDYINKTSFTSAAICSVNSLKKNAVIEKLETRNIPIFNADISKTFNLKINYETPQTLGMDRVCSAVGALSIAANRLLIKENQYLITIDFGTATTINIVSPEKEFVGGLIAPGVQTMFRSLYEETAHLPMVKNLYQGLVGKSTEASIVSGVINSTLGMINETIIYLKSQSKLHPLIFITGGNASLISPYLKGEFIFEEALVLRGLKFIYDLNRNETI